MAAILIQLAKYIGYISKLFYIKYKCWNAQLQKLLKADAGKTYFTVQTAHISVYRYWSIIRWGRLKNIHDFNHCIPLEGHFIIMMGVWSLVQKKS